jgi:hypothetical protein
MVDHSTHRARTIDLERRKETKPKWKTTAMSSRPPDVGRAALQYQRKTSQTYHEKILYYNANAVHFLSLSFPKIMSNEQTTSPHSPGAPLSLFLSVGSDLALPHVELEEPIISQLY